MSKMNWIDSYQTKKLQMPNMYIKKFSISLSGKCKWNYIQIQSRSLKNAIKKTKTAHASKKGGAY